MTRQSDQLADLFEPGEERGLLRGLAADESWDRGKMWRLTGWGVASVGAMALAMLASQSSLQVRQEQLASAELARQSQMLQKLAKDSQLEVARLSAAIATLNSDRDRLFTRVSSVEEGLESVTGSVSRQLAAVARSSPSEPPSPAPTVQPPASVQVSAPEPVREPKDRLPVVASDDHKSTGAADGKPSESRMAESLVARSMLGPPEPSADRLDPAQSTELEKGPGSHAAAIASAAASPEAANPESTAASPVRRTEFGLDLGGAATPEGLRALWSKLTAENKPLASFHPLMVVKEQAGGVQFRLVAGPLVDAGAAAKACAAMTARDRFCEPAVYEGQRLSLRPPTPAAAPPAPTAPKAQRPVRKRNSVRPAPTPPAEPTPAPKSTSLSSFLGMR